MKDHEGLKPAIITFESLGQKNAAWWRFRVEFVADPSVLDVVNLLELVDNALADVTEGSDVIGQYPDIDAHLIRQFIMFQMIRRVMVCLNEVYHTKIVVQL